MNKSKLILAVTGGITGLLVLVMAFFVWTAFSAKTAAYEGDDDSDGLDGVVSSATSLSRKPVYPCLQSVKAIDANTEKVVTWKDDALQLVSKGDRAFKATTPAAFKTFIVADAKRLVEGFEFGPFKDYISGGKMPETTQLATLQRQWDDVALITETLVANGMKKLVAVDFAKAAAASEEAQEEKPKKGKKKAKKSAKAATAVSFNPSRQTYSFTFTIPPAGFTKVVNTLETCERFVVVDEFSFKREHDNLAEALGGEEKKQAQTSGRRRRRGAAQVEEKKEDENDTKGKIITDPMLDPPLLVSMTVSVYDFRTLEEKAEVKEEEE